MTTEYTTTDTNRAAFLLTRGIRLSRVDLIDDGHRVAFIFDNLDDRVKDAISAFAADSPVGVLKFISAYRDIRDAIFAAKKAGGNQ